jgi:ureidoglycolate lyase
MEVVVEPLLPETFAPFGDVVSAGLREGSAANQGTAVRFDWAAQFVNAREGAKPNLAVFRSVGRTLPLEVKLLERHPKSTQLFLPMVADGYVVIVAPDDETGGPDVARLRAFLARPGQGINYKPNVWHHPLAALGRDADFAMLAWEDGTALDCDVWPLPAPVLVRDA